MRIGRIRPVPQGAWDSATAYVTLDIVTTGGIAYMAIQDSPANTHPLTNPDYWTPISSQGAKGDTGATGPQGPTGAAGAAGLDGVDGAVGPIGPQGPAGPQGDAGPAGVQGPSPLTQWVGTTLSIQNPDGTWTDPIDLQGVQGVQGPIGPQGVKGPQGLQGDPGVTGPAGPQGPAGPSDWDAIPNKPSTFPPSTHAHDYVANADAVTAATADKVAKRDSSGDLRARLFRSNYGTSGMGGSAHVVFRNSTSDDYLRFATKATLQSWLGTPSANSAVKASNGYWKCGSTGVIHQWGVVASPASGSIITFPLSFPTYCGSVQLTANTGNTSTYQVNTGAVSKTNFKIYQRYGPSSVFWYATGY